MSDNIWGAQMFLQSIVRRLRTRQVGDSTDLRASLSPRVLQSARFPNSWNILLLGAPGCGKSSLAYTLWRSLTDASVSTDDRAVDTSSVGHLSLDWNFLEFNESDSFEVAVEALEEPTVLMLPEEPARTNKTAYVDIQSAAEACSGISVIDTPGVSQMDDRETAFVEGCLSGSLGEGSGLDGAPAVVAATGLSYWVPRYLYAPYPPTPLEPHVVALVMDMSILSFQDMLDVDVFSNDDWRSKVPQLAAYHTMIDLVIERGLQIFVILTHLDSYHKTFENIIPAETTPRAASEADNADAETLSSLEDMDKCVEEESRLGEDMMGEIKGIYLQLSQSLSFGGRDVPPDRIFVVENYRNAKRRVESRLELAAAEGLEMMLDAADVFVQTRYNAEAANCIIS